MTFNKLALTLLLFTVPAAHAERPKKLIAPSEASGLVTALLTRWLDARGGSEGDGICPTILSASGHGCTATANAIQLDYVGCHTSPKGGRWTGGERWVMNGGSPTCGTAPDSHFTGSITQVFLPGTRHEKSGHTLIFEPGRGVTTTLVGGKKHQAEIASVHLKSDELELTLETPTLLALEEQGSVLKINGEIRAFDHHAGKPLWLQVKDLRLDAACETPIGGTVEAATKQRGAPILKTSFGPGCQKITAQAIL